MDEYNLNRIYLLGMPGSGKSTLGRLIAQKLFFHFIDLDEEIEKKEASKVPEIFEKRGEPYFRNSEKNTLNTLLKNDVVIATGGGTPCFFDNLSFIHQNGFSIFLDTPLELIAQRVVKQQGTRPLLQGQSSKEMLARLGNLYKDRLPYYQQADMTYAGGLAELDELVALLQEKLSL